MRDGEPTVRRGRCLCGAVRYEVIGEPVIVAHCHCADCQRLTGAGHSTVAMYAKPDFRMSGEPCREYRLVAENGNEVTRGFCGSCGSPIYGHNSGNTAHLSVTLGTLEESADLEPAVAIFTRNRKPWDVVGERVEAFDAQPAWQPDAPS